MLVGVCLWAAPLTWFPGPAMDYPGSDAATVVMPGLGNVVIAGTTAYPEGLIATNLYWTPLGQPFSGNIAPGAVASGGQIIVYGGNNGASSSSAVISYSPSDGVSALASMSVPRSYLGYAPDRSGNAYAIGGLDDSGNPLASAEVYSQDSGTWAAIASLPTALYDFPAVFNGSNYIYTFGGFTDTTSGTATTTVLRYSISADAWTALAPMPVPVAGSAAALGADGKIYVVGGTSGGVTINLVQVYDPVANSWTISTPLPEGLSASVMGVDSLGRLIVMGGMDTNGNDVGDVWRSQQLGTTDSPPVLTQVPGTNADYGTSYTSTIAATGNPQPVYVLVKRSHQPDGELFQRPNHLDPAGARSDRGHSGDHCGHQLRRRHQLDFQHHRPQPAAGDTDQLISCQRNRIFGDVGLVSRRPGGWFRDLWRLHSACEPRLQGQRRQRHLSTGWFHDFDEHNHIRFNAEYFLCF